MANDSVYKVSSCDFHPVVSFSSILFANPKNLIF
mgnify:CR=1 FL=1